jgi:hypothetical protein
LSLKRFLSLLATAMPLPHVQDTDDEDDVQLLPPIKSVRSGRTLKPSALLTDPDNVANVPGQRKHVKATKVVDTDQHKNKKQKTIDEPALVTKPSAKTAAKPTELVMSKEPVSAAGQCD